MTSTPKKSSICSKARNAQIFLVFVNLNIRDLSQRYESLIELRVTSLVIRQVRFGSFASFRIAHSEWRRWRQKVTLTMVKTMDDVTLAQRNVIHDVVVIVPRNQHGGSFLFFQPHFHHRNYNWHENNFDRVDCSAAKGPYFAESPLPSKNVHLNVLQIPTPSIQNIKK
jgi:hypothetical protein